MMDCLDLEALLQYMHGEVGKTETEMEEVRRHITNCQQCRQELTTLQDLAVHLGGAERSMKPIPDSSLACIDVMTLTAYIDHRLIGAEREQVEQHLSSCQTCLDTFMAAVQQLDATAAVPMPAPPSLIEKATALGAVETPPFSSWRYRLREGWQSIWVALLHPQRHWAWAGVAAAILIVSYIAISPFRSPTDPSVRGSHNQEIRGYGFGVTEAVRMQGRLRLSSTLRQALDTYQEQPTSEAARSQLLALLAQAPLQVPDNHVTTIEINRSLQMRLQTVPQEVRELQITLLQDGLLLIAEAP